MIDAVSEQSKPVPSISPQQAQQLVQAQMLQQLQSAVQAGQIPPALASVPPTPSLFIQLHHLVQLQQVLQRLQLQQASAYAAHQQARLPRLPSVRPDPLAIKIAKIRQQIVALHLQIKQACRQPHVLSAAASAAATNLPQDATTFDASHDLARDFPGSMMIRDDLAASWKSALPDSVRGSGTGDLPHSMSQSLDTWPGWPSSMLTAPPPDTCPPGADGSGLPAHDAVSSSAAALDIEEFIPGKPWQGPTIRSAEDDPFITPGGASSSVVGVDDKLRSVKSSQDMTTSQLSTTSNNGWPVASAHESTDHNSSVTARAPPGLVPSSPWLQQPPSFTRSTSWTPQSSYGECCSFMSVELSWLLFRVAGLLLLCLLVLHSQSDA